MSPGVNQWEEQVRPGLGEEMSGLLIDGCNEETQEKITLSFWPSSSLNWLSCPYGFPWLHTLEQDPLRGSPWHWAWVVLNSECSLPWLLCRGLFTPLLLTMMWIICFLNRGKVLLLKWLRTVTIYGHWVNFEWMNVVQLCDYDYKSDRSSLLAFDDTQLRLDF